MDFDIAPSLTRSRLRVKVSHHASSGETFAQDVEKGLSSQPKYLHPRYLYDKVGSELFEQICELPEYYPTRTESAIIKNQIDEIIDSFHRQTVLIELGSGSSVKTQLIISAILKKFGELKYAPIDISKTMLVESSKSLLRQYEGLEITAFASEYVTALNYFRQKNIRHKVILFLGSSIGNFDSQEARAFLQEIRATMCRGDYLLIGMDLIKPPDILIPAYDDSDGVTARFNLNILTRINRELQANFDPNAFRHKTIFNESFSRIEMHLESLKRQTVAIAELGRSFEFEKGETIHTENSYKFSEESIAQLANACGFRVEHAWYDENNWFSLNLMKPV